MKRSGERIVFFCIQGSTSRRRPRLPHHPGRTGVVAAEGDTSITLRDTAGRSETLLRARIDTMRALGVSPMPEGLEAAIPPARMADLIAWLRARD